MDEGYVKFQSRRTEAPPPSLPGLEALNGARARLYDAGLIGMLANGIGFGNVSLRGPGEKAFVISATGSGGKRWLDPEDWVLVEDFDLDRNLLWSKGRRDASSESMSHGAVYRASPEVAVVIHIHSQRFWRAMLAKGLPATPPDLPYGTPEMAWAICRHVSDGGAPSGVVAMAGHEDGILAYGASVGGAVEALGTAWGTAGLGVWGGVDGWESG